MRCPCLEHGDCPAERIPDCAACEGFSTMGYMAAMAYRLEERVEALEQLRDRLEALYGLWEAGGPAQAACPLCHGTGNATPSWDVEQEHAQAATPAPGEPIYDGEDNELQVAQPAQQPREGGGA